MLRRDFAPFIVGPATARPRRVEMLRRDFAPPSCVPRRPLFPPSQHGHGQQRDVDGALDGALCELEHANYADKGHAKHDERLPERLPEDADLGAARPHRAHPPDPTLVPCSQLS